jgi:hypothetical protein
MKDVFANSEFFKQEFKIFLNILISFLIQEIHRFSIEQQLIWNISKFTEVANQNEPEENFPEFIESIVNRNISNPFNEEIYEKIDEVIDLEGYNTILQKLKEMVAEMELTIGESVTSKSKKQNSKIDRKKKLESSVLIESTENNFVKDILETISTEMQMRINFLFKKFEDLGENIINLKQHQIQTVEEINKGMIQGEKHTVETLCMFLGNPTLSNNLKASL